MNHKYSTAALVLLFVLGVVILEVDAISEYLWTNEVLPGSVTLINTSEHLCVGGMCYPAYQFSVESNGSIGGSPICTPANGFCSGNITLNGTSDGNNYTIDCDVTGTGTKTAQCSRTGMANFSFSWTDIDTDLNNYTLDCDVSGGSTKTATCAISGGVNYTFSWNDLDTDSDTTYSEADIYLTLVGTIFGFNETKLNETIDARAEGGNPGGADTEIQYNDNGVFNGSSTFTYDKINDIVYLPPGGIGGKPGDDLFFFTDGGILDFTASDEDGGGYNVQFTAGNNPGPTDGDGGDVIINAGTGFGTGEGGGFGLFANNGGANGPGGNVDIAAGDAGGGNNNGGDIETYIGGGTGTGRYGRFVLYDNTGGRGEINIDSLTQTRNFTLPDKDGTFAMLSDIVAGNDETGGWTNTTTQTTTTLKVGINTTAPNATEHVVGESWIQSGTGNCFLIETHALSDIMRIDCTASLWYLGANLRPNTGGTRSIGIPSARFLDSHIINGNFTNLNATSITLGTDTRTAWPVDTDTNTWWPLNTTNQWIINNSNTLDWNTTKGDARYASITSVNNLQTSLTSLVTNTSNTANQLTSLTTNTTQTQTSLASLVINTSNTQTSLTSLTNNFTGRTDLGTVTQITCGDGLSCTPITTTGTITLNDTYSGGFSATNFTATAYFSTGGYPMKAPDWDYYPVIDNEFWTTSSQAYDDLVGSAISSGTITNVAGEANHWGIQDISDSINAGGGYRIITDVNAILIAGGEKSEFGFQCRGARAGAAFYMGFLDQTTFTRPTDGIYFNVTNCVVRAEVKNNGFWVNSTTTFTLNASQWYYAVAETNLGATATTFSIYDKKDGGLYWSSVVTATHPTAAGRETGWGLLAGEATTDAAAVFLRMDKMRMSVKRNLVR